ncbi:MAG: prepilin-type N-terminal cleavage/methylation domain-containing protein [bacterium]|nr:prepilin-type N-terminal cleavage/methylation domain-containing protein [bacterium]
MAVYLRKPYIRSTKNGFVLIELLLVVSIIALITVFVFNTLTTFRQQSDIDSVGEGILGALRLARSKTISSENASSYGVHFESATYTLFMGRTYTSGSSLNEDHALPSQVEIFNIALSTSTQAVVFDRLTGHTSTIGTISIRPQGSVVTARTIQIDSSGDVSVAASSISALNTRITDTRHLHFDLGWSIQNATTLRLRFYDSPNPDVVTDVTMTPTPPRTSFSWEGDTDVYGQNQHVKVSAHSLDISNTLLSIQRHKDQNTKAVKVSIIDGVEKDVVSYAASGTSTVEIYGGVMSVQ